MTPFFQYPEGAAFGRVLPKSKVYGHAKVSAKRRELFVSQVDRIVWEYKLAPETINLPATKIVPEIQIFSITLRTGALNDDVLRSIDKAIAFPIIFEVHYAGKRKAIATFKRPSDADGAKWVISEYFGTDWVSESAPRASLPIVLNLGALYDKLLDPLLPLGKQKGEGIQSRVERMERIRAKERELTKIEDRLAREKQFNRRVEINAELRDVKQELEQLTGAQARGGVRRPQRWKK